MGASEQLQDAGLYHAAYGTAGFELSMVCTNQRDRIAQIIGTDAEEIVYQYCACDRKVFFAELAKKQNPLFPNRFNGQHYRLSKALLKNFCELTAANEVEIAIDNPVFVEEHGQGLNRIFSNMTANLSPAAIAQTTLLFG